ncbi:hypothetical protein P9112_011659 [Eukaryota sp. TZLM1-RC]
MTSELTSSVTNLINRLSTCSDPKMAGQQYRKGLMMLNTYQKHISDESLPIKRLDMEKNHSDLLERLKHAYYTSLRSTNTSIREAQRQLFYFTSASPKPKTDSVRQRITAGLERTRDHVREEIERTDAIGNRLEDTRELLDSTLGIHHRIASSLKRGHQTLRSMKREELLSLVFTTVGFIIFGLVCLKIILSRIFRIRF